MMPSQPKVKINSKDSHAMPASTIVEEEKEKNSGLTGGNPYVEQLQKRIRAANKRLQRISKIEEKLTTTAVADLEAEQRTALEAKDSVVAMLESFEGLIKSFRLLDDEDAKERKKQRKQMAKLEHEKSQLLKQLESQKDAHAASLECELKDAANPKEPSVDSMAAQAVESLQILHLLEALCSSETVQVELMKYGASGMSPLTEDELMAAIALRQMLVPKTTTGNLAKTSNEASVQLREYLTRSTRRVDSVSPVTFAQLNDILNRLQRSGFFNPKPAASSKKTGSRKPKDTVAAVVQQEPCALLKGDSSYVVVEDAANLETDPNTNDIATVVPHTNDGSAVARVAAAAAGVGSQQQQRSSRGRRGGASQNRGTGRGNVVTPPVQQTPASIVEGETVATENTLVQRNDAEFRGSQHRNGRFARGNRGTPVGGNRPQRREQGHLRQPQPRSAHRNSSASGIANGSVA